MVELQEIERQIRMAVETGDVVLGSNQTIKLLKLGKPKLVIVAANCPAEIREDIEYYAELADVPVFVYPGTSMDLGDVCGRPHVVASMAVLDDGESDLIATVRKAMEEGAAPS